MFGAAEGAGLEQIGRSTQFVGAQLQEAAQRKQRRDDAIQNSRIYNQRNRERQEAFNTARGTQDFSDPAVFNAFLQQQDAADLELLNNYQGSEEGRLELEEQLFGLSDRYTGAAISEHGKAALAAAEITVNEQADPLIISLFRQPERASQIFSELTAVARRVAPVFDTVSEDQLLRILNDKASAAIIEGLRARPDAAQAALTDLISEGKISSDLAIDAQRRIDNLQTELDLRAAAGSGTDVEAIPDPTSSTGWRYVPKIAGGEAPAPSAEGGAKSSDVDRLRGQYLGQSTRFEGIRDAYMGMRETAARASPAGDISLIVSFFKMIDPTSTVREGEAATAEQAASLPNRLVNMYNRLIATGERLQPEQRNDILAQADARFRGARTQQEQTQQQFRAAATEQLPGFNPENVIPDLIGPTREFKPLVTAPSAGSQTSAGQQIGDFIDRAGSALGFTAEEPAAAEGLGFSREDVEATAQAEGMSIDQVLDSVIEKRGLKLSRDEIKQQLGL